jgi:hypothetical protein
MFGVPRLRGAREKPRKLSGDSKLRAIGWPLAAAGKRRLGSRRSLSQPQFFAGLIKVPCVFKTVML